MNKVVNEKIKLARISAILLLVFTCLLLVIGFSKINLLINHEAFFKYFDENFNDILNLMAEFGEIKIDIHEIRAIFYIYSCVSFSISLIFEMLILIFSIVVLRFTRLPLNEFVLKKKYLITLAVLSFLSCVANSFNILVSTYPFSIFFIISGVLLLVAAFSNKEAEKITANRLKYGNDPFAKNNEGHSVYEENINQQIQQNISQDSITVKSEKELNELFTQIAELERKYKNGEVSLESYQMQKEILLNKIKD